MLLVLVLLVAASFAIGTSVFRKGKGPAAPQEGAGAPGTTIALPNSPSAGTDVMQLAASPTHSTSLSESLPVSLLQQSVHYVGVTLDGDGVDDPEPTPGSYDWSSMDARMRQLAPLRLPIVLKVFNAPDWMKAVAGPKGSVSPAHYQDFADLAVAAAQRYPQIHYFEIWNELWGFRNGTGPWNYRGYTDFYNTVYTALKTYNPQLQVGGPYAPFPPATDPQFASSLTGPWGAIDQRSLDAVTYWLQHKAGADFIVVDGRTGQPTQTPQQPAGSTEMFAAVDRWIRSQTSLPIWWNEWYAESAQLGPSEWDAVSADALLQLASSGASMANLFQAEYVSNLTAYPQLVQRHGVAPTPGLWMQGSDAPTGLAPVFETLQNRIYGSSVSLSEPVAGVEVLLGGSHYVAVDVDGADHTVSVAGRTLTLGPWQIATG